MTAAQQLAALIAEAAARGPGSMGAEQSGEAARLVAMLGSDPDERAIDEFFACLVSELRERGAKLPPLEQLPPMVAPLIAALGDAVEPEADHEAIADRLDRTYEELTGASPRKERARRMEAEMRERVATSVAESVRQQGLTSVRDGEPEDEG